MGYLYLNNLDKKQQEKNENRNYVKYSDKAKELAKKELSEYEFDKQLKKILDDPEEIDLISKRIEEEEELKKTVSRFQEEMIKEAKESRKLAYKYENVIFEIFDIHPYLEKKELLQKIQYFYNSNELEAENLFSIWNKHSLVGCIDSKEQLYNVGGILTNELYKLTNSDLTRTEWLTLNGKIQEYNKKINDLNHLKENRLAEEKQKRQELINKYKNEILFIFSLSKSEYLDHQSILNAIQGCYGLSLSEAQDLFQLWLESYLIAIDMWKADNGEEDKYKVGRILKR